MLVYRIVHKNYSHMLYASGMQGRWNSAGRKVVYAAESVALAFLENMIRRQGVGFNKDFKTMVIEIPSADMVEVLDPLQLTDKWRSYVDYTECQKIGDRWYNKAVKPVLKVPSAVIPENFNYVLNTEHEMYKLIKLVDVLKLVPDERIEDILSRYKK